MNTNRWSRWTHCRAVAGLIAMSVCVVASQIPMHAGQTATSDKEKSDDVAAFKVFSGRVQAYLKLQKAVASGLPLLKPTDLPEMIAAHQQVLARKLKEARPGAKAGDIFTPAACEAFRHVSRAALEGTHATARAYMDTDAANPNMRLVVNGIYPDTAPITALPPALLAAFPPLPAEVAYRVVGRTLIVIDVQSRLIVDIARLILPSAS